MATLASAPTASTASLNERGRSAAAAPARPPAWPPSAPPARAFLPASSAAPSASSDAASMARKQSLAVASNELVSKPLPARVSRLAGVPIAAAAHSTPSTSIIARLAPIWTTESTYRSLCTSTVRLIGPPSLRNGVPMSLPAQRAARAPLALRAHSCLPLPARRVGDRPHPHDPRAGTAFEFRHRPFQRGVDERRGGDDGDVATVAQEAHSGPHLGTHAARRELALGQVGLGVVDRHLQHRPLLRRAVVEQHGLDARDQHEGLRSE